MTVTRHLALWACALSVTTTAAAYEDTGRPGPDGIWKVCSPAWAFPQLDDAALTAGASAASERRVVMAVLRGYRQALACAQSA